jgi:hypothetical protein
MDADQQGSIVSSSASFAQHVLPSGFQKIRYYGWMSPNNKLKLAKVRWLVWLHRGWTFWLGSAMFQPKVSKLAIPTCCECGGELEVIAITGSTGVPLWKKQIPVRGPP